VIQEKSEGLRKWKHDPKPGIVPHGTGKGSYTVSEIQKCGLFALKNWKRSRRWVNEAVVGKQEVTSDY